YEYGKGRTGRRLFLVKGISGWGSPIVQAPQRRRSGKAARKVDLFLVGTDEAKLTVSRRLAQTNVGPGYCHIPDTREAEWFKQITAEKMVTRYVKGQPVREWTKPDRARNEAFDCRVYALAALKIMHPPLKRLAERMGADAAAPPAPPPPVADVPPAEIPKPKAVHRRPIPAPRTPPVENPQGEAKPAVQQTRKTTKSNSL